jgi:hypothetical protein
MALHEIIGFVADSEKSLRPCGIDDDAQATILSWHASHHGRLMGISQIVWVYTGS